MQAIVRRTSNPSGTQPTTMEFSDLEALLAFIEGSGFPCILLIEDVDGTRTLQVEVYDE